jgi:RNA 3'-terminal phosphate cyclase (ATP)
MISLDGSLGEGGGQILRTALALSIVTGQPFVLDGVRAGRARPGLLRQHLTGLEAAAVISGATVEGAALGSLRVAFRPGPAVAGDYHFDIGSAGSAGLVLQTILPPLLQLSTPSTVTVRGGTHNGAAPSFHFLDRCFAPHVGLRLYLERWGFYPAGGGELRAEITPRQSTIDLLERGPIQRVQAHVALSQHPRGLGRETLDRLASALGLEPPDLHLHVVPQPRGPGFAVWVEARSDGGTALFTAFGERRPSSAVADLAVQDFVAWRDHGAPVDAHLADQLLIPLALYGGAFRTGPHSLHTVTNLQVIDRFLPGCLEVDGDVIRRRG